MGPAQFCRHWRQNLFCVFRPFIVQNISVYFFAYANKQASDSPEKLFMRSCNMQPHIYSKSSVFTLTSHEK